MKNDVQIFQNDAFGSLRTVDEDGKIMFVATDVAKMLGYTNPSKAISDHCKGGNETLYPYEWRKTSNEFYSRRRLVPPNHSF